MTYLPFGERLRPVLMSFAALLVTGAGCQSNVEEKIALAQLAQSCLVNSDCNAPLVCAFESCHAECESSRDCDGGARCVAAARPYKVCQLEEERLCQRTSDCAEGLVCGVDGECRDQCQSDSQCVEGQLCVSGTCADKNELDDGGQLTPAKGVTRGEEGSPCVYVSDCTEALLCRSQACAAECKADKDCPSHQTCTSGRCVADGSQPSSCTYNSQCDTKRGERCLGGSCLCQCVEDRDCPSGQVCDGCGCTRDPSAPPSCIYNSDCKSPGQICKDRACACECQADADCQAGTTCDGCGCVNEQQPQSGVIRGNVFVDSTLQLGALRGVTEIHGNLFISSAALADFGDTFAQLVAIDGQLQITNCNVLTKIAFPKLRSVTSAYISLGGAVAIDLPVLESGSLNINTMASLTQLDLGAFSSGDLWLAQLPKLPTLELPALTSVHTLQLNDVPLVAELDLPALTTVTDTFYFGSSSPSALAKLSAPLLSQFTTGPNGSGITIDNTQLTSLAGIGADGFVGHAKSLQITRNPGLSVCASELFAQHFLDRTYTTMSDLMPCATSCTGEVCPG